MNSQDELSNEILSIKQFIQIEIQKRGALQQNKHTALKNAESATDVKLIQPNKEKSCSEYNNKSKCRLHSEFVTDLGLKSKMQQNEKYMRIDSSGMTANQNDLKQSNVRDQTTSNISESKRTRSSESIVTERDHIMSQQSSIGDSTWLDSISSGSKKQRTYSVPRTGILLSNFLPENVGSTNNTLRGSRNAENVHPVLDRAGKLLNHDTLSSAFQVNPHFSKEKNDVDSKNKKVRGLSERQVNANTNIVTGNAIGKSKARMKR